jgi:uncharacterized protein (DUF433 family)
MSFNLNAQVAIGAIRMASLEFVLPLVSFSHRTYFQTMQAIAYRYLVNLPGVCSGRTIVEGTRIGVHDIVSLMVNGATIEDVLRSFPDITKAQIYECLSYYEDHRTEIDALVAEQMSEALA